MIISWMITKHTKICYFPYCLKCIICDWFLNIIIESTSVINRKLGTILVVNDDVMTSSWYNKMGLLWNSQQTRDIGQHFWFWYISVRWLRCVICPQHVTVYLSFLFFILTIALDLLTPMKNSYHDHLSSLTVLWGGTTQKAAPIVVMAMGSTIHHSCYYLCHQSFWQPQLHQWKSSPPAKKLVSLF